MQDRPKRFKPCEQCKQLGITCPGTTQVDTQALAQNTPFAQWKTPEQLGERYSYTAKHIIRLAAQHPEQIRSVVVGGRWYILECTFALFLDNSKPLPPT